MDFQTGDIHVADVGQNQVEEIDLLIAGGNYGWNLKEGSFFFDPNDNDDGVVTDVDPGVPAGLIDPVAEYDHDEGIAIIGGFVYRGTTIPALAGKYVFGDFGNFTADAGRIFYLDDSARIQAFDLGTDTRLPLAVNGFGQDANGEIYVMTNTTGTPFGTTGVVWRIDPAVQPAPPLPPATNSGGGSSGLSPLMPMLLVILGWLRYRTIRMRRRY